MKIRRVSFVIGAATAGYIAKRLGEWLCLRRLPTVNGLLKMSTRQVYRRAVWTERCEKRSKRRSLRRKQSNLALKLVVLIMGGAANISSLSSPWFFLPWVPSRAYRRLRIQQALMHSMRKLDDTFDGDREPSQGDAEECFRYASALMVMMETMAEPTRQEALRLVYLVIAARRLLGFDPLPDMQAIWRDYTPDTVRGLRGEIFPSEEDSRRALNSFKALYQLAARILGLPDHIGKQYAMLDVENLTAYDNLIDLPHDLERGWLPTPRSVYEPWDVDIDRLLKARTWLEIAAVPGMREYLEAETARLRQEWACSRPRLETEVAPYIPTRLLRKLILADWAARSARLENLPEQLWAQSV